jgi:dephospho-CoA kinase
MPDAEKRARADYVVDTGQGIESARRQVDAIIADLRRTGHRKD